MLLLDFQLSTVGQRVAASGLHIIIAVQAGMRRRGLRYPIWVGNKNNENASFGPEFVSCEIDAVSAVTAKSKKPWSDESRPKGVFHAEL